MTETLHALVEGLPETSLTTRLLGALDCNVTSDPKLLELVGLAKNVKLEYGDTDEAYAFLQSLWDITDGDGITAANRALIDKLPKI